MFQEFWCTIGNLLLVFWDALAGIVPVQLMHLIGAHAQWYANTDGNQLSNNRINHVLPRFC